MIFSVAVYNLAAGEPMNVVRGPFAQQLLPGKAAPSGAYLTTMYSLADAGGPPLWDYKSRREP